MLIDDFQALHNYTVYTFVFVGEPMLTRKFMIPILLICPLLVVAPTAIALFSTYTNDVTCWVDFSQTNAIIEMAPNAIMAAVAIILSEATPMRKFKVNESADPVARATAVSNARSGVFISLVSIG